MRRILKAAFVLELMLEIAVTLQNLFQIVAGLRHAMLELMHLVLDLLQVAKGGERRFVHGRPGLRK